MDNKTKNGLTWAGKLVEDHNFWRLVDIKAELDSYGTKKLPF